MIPLKSAITGKLLGYFFLNPHESLYVNELVRKLRVDKRNLVKKLNELERENILQSRPRGNLKLYSVNQKYPLYNEYKKIISKTIGLEASLKTVLTAVPGVQQAFIYGSYAGDAMAAHSDIDLLVVGAHKIVELQSRLTKLQRAIDRGINTVSMGQAEFARKNRNQDQFIRGILKKKHIRII